MHVIVHLSSKGCNVYPYNRGKEPRNKEEHMSENKITDLIDNYKRARREVVGHDLYDLQTDKMKTRARGAWLRLVEEVGSEEEARALVDLR